MSRLLLLVFPTSGVNVRSTSAKLLIAATLAGIALLGQGHNTGCTSLGDKQDCHQCCVDSKQAAFAVCDSLAESQKQACLDQAQDTFNACINACKDLLNK